MECAQQTTLVHSVYLQTLRVFLFMCVLGVGVMYHSKLRFIIMYGPSGGHLLCVYIQQEMTGTEMTWFVSARSLSLCLFCHRISFRFFSLLYVLC